MTEAAPKKLADPNDLANHKIGVQGDMVSGMSGTETVYGAASVTGTNVTYGQAAAKPVTNNQQKLVQHLAMQEHQIDGVAYESN